MFSPTVIEIFHSANKVTLTRRKCIEQCTFFTANINTKKIVEYNCARFVPCEPALMR